MTGNSEAYRKLGKAWQSTCTILFGQEACPLSDCHDWLLEYASAYEGAMLVQRKSSDGQSIIVSNDVYPLGARYVAFDDIDFGRKFNPISINSLKDINSLMEAIQERIAYTGNVVLGNSSQVEGSTDIIDSHFVLDSTMMADSKYIAYSRGLKYSEYCFGSFGGEKNTHLVKCMGSSLRRCFECQMAELLVDCYYCIKAQNSHDCMFCFGIENTAYMMGNTVLTKDKYAALKAKLTAEMADELQKKKRIFSMFAMLGKVSTPKEGMPAQKGADANPSFSIQPIEKAFSTTTSLVLGKPLPNIDLYQSFLQRNIPKNRSVPSALSGQPTVAGGYRANLIDIYKIGGRMATDDEMRLIGKVRIGEEKALKLAFNLEKLAKSLEPIAYCNIDKVAGNVSNKKNSAVIVNSQDCYWSSSVLGSKKCGFSFWVSGCESIFGSSDIFDSSFCLKCYNSKKLARCFEADSCESCSGCYFCHNCENVHDSMFCFNVKNLKYAVGNVEVGREQFLRLKKLLTDEIASSLEKKHDYGRSVYGLWQS